MFNSFEHYNRSVPLKNLTLLEYAFETQSVNPDTYFKEEMRICVSELLSITKYDSRDFIYKVSNLYRLNINVYDYRSRNIFKIFSYNNLIYCQKKMLKVHKLKENIHYCLQMNEDNGQLIDNEYYLNYKGFITFIKYHFGDSFFIELLERITSIGFNYSIFIQMYQKNIINELQVKVDSLHSTKESHPNSISDSYRSNSIIVDLPSSFPENCSFSSNGDNKYILDIDEIHMRINSIVESRLSTYSNKLDNLIYKIGSLLSSLDNSHYTPPLPSETDPSKVCMKKLIIL